MIGKPTYGQCLDCLPGEPRLLVNKRNKLCEYHNRIMLIAKAALKLSKVPMSKRKPIKPGNRNAARNNAFYKRIWREREHKCVECNTHLGDRFNSCFISHIVPRGSNIRLAYDPENVQIHCLKCHNRWDKGDRKGMKSFSQDIYDSLTLKSYER